MTTDRSTQQPRVWVLLGRKAGDNNQLLALAEELGWPWEGKQIINRATELITNLTLGTTLAGIDRRRSSPLQPPWPDLVLSAGRRNEPVARWIKRQSGNRTRLVQMGRPWSPLPEWDLIVTTPQYFLPEQDNVLHNQLPLHGITPAGLQRASDGAKRPWQHLPHPHIAVLLGGNSGPFVFTPDKGNRMGELVNAMAIARGGSVLVTDSRRTPRAAGDAFRGAISAPLHRHSWRDGGKDNPYMTYLATADILVVTGDSMSMLAEAQVTGKPLYVFDLSERSGKWWLKPHNFRHQVISHRLAMAIGPQRMKRDIARIQEVLVGSGKARWLEDWNRESLPSATPNNCGDRVSETTVAAERIRQLFT